MALLEVPAFARNIEATLKKKKVHLPASLAALVESMKTAVAPVGPAPTAPALAVRAVPDLD